MWYEGSFLFFTQETKKMVQKDARSAGPRSYHRPAVLILRGQSATPGMEHLSLSFSICSFLTWKQFFPEQPQQLERNSFRLDPCPSTNNLCPFLVEPLFLLGNFSNIGQRLLHLKTRGRAPPLEWAIRYVPIPQSQLVLPSKRYKSWEKTEQGSCLGRTGRRDDIVVPKCHPTSPKGFKYGLD